jgi:hypothetical protein
MQPWPGLLVILRPNSMTAFVRGSGANEKNDTANIPMHMVEIVNVLFIISPIQLNEFPILCVY